MDREVQLGGLMDTCRERPASSLYVHIPFCAHRCYYCDFTVTVATKSVDTYLDDLSKECELLASQASEPLRTLFIGGGTPTLLNNRQLSRLLSILETNFTLSKRAEITVEANPDTVDDEKLAILRARGVNRISFGAQTWNDQLLKTIGRTHDAQAIEQSVKLARDAGFERLNVDLMFGLPGQTLHDVRESLMKLMELGVGHVSAYWLKVEPGTPFAVWQKRGKLSLPGEDLEADMYDLVRETLQSNGLAHYEVSNFALPGQEALHNLVYWHNEPYLAAGIGAHGYVHGLRYENVNNLRKYHERLVKGERPIQNEHDVDLFESVEDTMMLGLRLQQGVSQSRFEKRHGKTPEQVFGKTIRRLVEKGLLQRHGDFLSLTDRAWPIANVVFEEFVSTQAAD